jgi:sigma-B regulation protein RsbU (phosphoserine phosphatase)
MPDRHGLGGPGAEAILAPFRGLVDGLSIAIEDASGNCVAGTSSDAPPASVVAREIAAGPFAGGRVVAWGSLAGTPLAEATVASLAVALGIAHTIGRGGIADVAAARLIDDELALGRQLQRSFVGLVGPEVPGYDLACYYEQAHQVGGDFFDVFRRLRRGRPLSVVIADVTGKGVAAALLMAFARPLIHAAIDNSSGPADALERTNRVLLERRSALFITALCGSLTLSSGRLRLANAGHEAPLIVRRDGSPIAPIAGSGSLLGAFPSLDLTESVTDLAPGDLALFYTDGVTDAKSIGGERFEDARLFEAIEAARGGSASEVVESIRGAVEQFQAGALPADDITIVVIGRRMRGARRRRSPPAVL